MNVICDEYVKMIQDNFLEEVKSIIIYGSNIYDGNTSDLDVCLLLDECDKNLKDNIINFTLNFHKQYHLRIDEEVPYHNKLIYLTEEIEDTLKNPPFYKNGKIEIDDIEKNKEFLSSKEMKKRLLLNILTTDHITIGQPTTSYEKKAIKLMLDVIVQCYHLKNPTAEEVLTYFYQNPYTGSEGEMYLGYKKNKVEKEKYLKKIVTQSLRKS